jgi:hypothetical protein
MQKQEVEAELRKSKKKAREGVTWETARKLEREFEAQEMVSESFAGTGRTKPNTLK